jgi:hypothetical protein
METGKAKPEDLNQYAWDALFTGKVNDEDIAIAQDSVSKQKNYSVLHTLACLYAEAGKTKEARQMLLAAMRAGNRGEPDGEALLLPRPLRPQSGGRQRTGESGR